MQALQPSNRFSDECRRWRKHRRLSQLELALAAEVSQRHLSWLETGRSQPSREMVLKLAGALDLPLRDCNALLNAAGFASIYRESALEDPSMAPVHDALRRMLDHHDPLPALVIDRMWNLVMHNQAAEQLLKLAGIDGKAEAPDGGAPPLNLAALTVHPDGLRRIIANWDEAAPAMHQRMRREAAAATDAGLRRQFAKWIDQIGPVPTAETAHAPLLPVLPLALAIGPVTLKLFSTFSTFGTPQDITTDELRVEMFYPADDATRAFFQRAGETSHE